MEDNNNREQPEEVHGGDSVSSEVERMLTWLFSTESDVEGDEAIELSRFLEASITKTSAMKVKIIDDPCYWHPLIFQTAASYITINGNEEVCGSSFSDSDTSYMAGIGMVNGGGLVVGDGGAWDGGVDEARGWMDIDEDWNCLVNAAATDDDMLEKFLGGEVAQPR
ncbi:hypothetical protein QVD17_26528 [Tagetes erecta]|uniref:Uncharacterized protein n=1 Tax=Tagetes erecta TaxID=13708 RepID=A0AAD8KAA5_TARER|nr:hypothetical protein QVD17_26528 [Tagetes erecta]